MFFIDPLYLIVLLIGGGLSALASMWVKKRVNKWGEVGLKSGMTGRQIAREILRKKGITDVTIEVTEGRLSDHYDPTSKTLRLSPDNHDGRSVTAAGISAHEVGHAIQHQAGYAPMSIRQKMVPVANIGTNLGMWLVVGGLLIDFTGLAKLGVILFGGAVAFTLITLPVEFDASARAKETLEEYGIVTSDELEGVSEVLTAAAATYVAAAVTAILQLLYFVFRVYGDR
jgi:Zn-dependent membrane protease YugP